MGSPTQGHRLPDAGVVTLGEQAEYLHASGPAVEMVRKWRRLRTDDAGIGSRVDHVTATPLV